MNHYPKSCPNCGSKNIKKNESYGFLCNKCGFLNRRGDFKAFLPKASSFF